MYIKIFFVKNRPRSKFDINVQAQNNWMYIKQETIIFLLLKVVFFGTPFMLDPAYDDSYIAGLSHRRNDILLLSPSSALEVAK